MGSPLNVSYAEFFRFMLQFLCLQMCVCGGSAVPQGGVGDRHLVTVPQGVVGDRLPWGGERQGPGGYEHSGIPPPPVSKNRLTQEPPPGSAVEFSTSPFFARVMGFSWFWWMWDSYSGVQDNISCVLLWAPPSWGTLSVSHSRTYPLNPSPLLSTPSPKQPAPDKETNKSQLNTVEH